MLICIPNVLTKEQVAFCRNKLNQAEWIDGKATTGTQSATVKSNVQIPQSSPVAHELGNVILDALANKPQFIFGAQEVKIAAGDMVLYPATSLHQVRPVTSGARLASFFWMQSMIRDDRQRTLLYDNEPCSTTSTRASRNFPCNWA